MNHIEIRRRLSEYLDNTLNDQDKSEIKLHLAECESCRAALADLERLLGHLKCLPEVEPPPWMTSKIMAHVHDKSGQKQGFWRRFFLPLHIKLPLEALALICICVTGYYMVQKNAPLTRPGELPPYNGMEINPPVPAEQVQQKSAAQKPKPDVEPTGTAAKLPPVPPILQDNVSRITPPSPAKTPVYPESTIKSESRFNPPDPTSLPSNMDFVAEPKAQQRKEAQMETSYRREQQQSEKWMKSAQQEKKALGIQMQRSDSINTRYPSDISGSSQQGYAPSEFDQKPVIDVERGRLAEISLRLDDPAAAIETIEEAITFSGGRIIRRLYNKSSNLLTARIDERKVPELIGRLKKIDKMLKSSPLSVSADREIDVLIRW